MTETHLAAAVRAAVDNWMQIKPESLRQAELEAPAALAAKLGQQVLSTLLVSGHTPAEVREFVMKSPSCHLEHVFVPDGLGATPLEFFPVPNAPGTMAARASALAVHGALGLETVSYGTENEGSLFVNLVAMPGRGAFAEKSKKSMRGHTDGVSFPFNGENDPHDGRIAPSPDLVTLLGLRNPNNVPTTLMPLREVLERMAAEDVAELKKPQFSIRSQKTFVQGMKRLLGAEHVVVAGPILMDVAGEGIYVRYSHSAVVPATDDDAAVRASNSLEAACNQSVEGVVVKPGDVLVVNNRLSLHGRGVVGEEVGGQSRWLLRTYGLDTSGLPPNKRRNQGAEPAHVLFP